MQVLLSYIKDCHNYLYKLLDDELRSFELIRYIRSIPDLSFRFDTLERKKKKGIAKIERHEAKWEIFCLKMNQGPILSMPHIYLFIGAHACAITDFCTAYHLHSRIILF